MLSQRVIQKLKNNWGDQASSLNCLAELRVYDPLSSWECYIYALNPEDEDEVECIVRVSHQQPPSVEKWYLTNIFSLFNEHGEGVEIDYEYRPRLASEILKKLGGR